MPVKALGLGLKKYGHSVVRLGPGRDSRGAAKGRGGAKEEGREEIKGKAIDQEYAGPCMHPDRTRMQCRY